MDDTLQRICKNKLDYVASRKVKIPEFSLEKVAQALSQPRKFADALEKQIRGGNYALIGEIKKASPSRGIIRPNFNPEQLARAYEDGGATCLSVLTDTPFFQGRDEFLHSAKEATQLPVLRKDFMVDPYQVVEARAIGADCILLIMAALGNAQAKELKAAASEWGMDVLVEVHTEEELERAIDIHPRLLGVNNRDLKTLNVDIATSETLANLIPDNCLAVCESGLNTPNDLSRMRRSGYFCFLVGESLMRQPDVALATKMLLKPEE